MTEITIERVCENCKTPFRVIPSRLKHGRGKHCSPRCQYDSIKSRPKKIIQRICVGCRNVFFIKESSLKGKMGAGKYCTRKCRDENRVGKLSTNFINGESGNWHGPNWYSQRRKALRRDKNTCVDCGITNSQALKMFKQSLHVHHKIPFRLFDGNYKKANSLKNLETLCPPCHRIKDGEIQKLERIHD